jgi:hypothetical protein
MSQLHSRNDETKVIHQQTLENYSQTILLQTKFPASFALMKALLSQLMPTFINNYFQAEYP